jgi:hypothetical protein
MDYVIFPMLVFLPATMITVVDFLVARKLWRKEKESSGLVFGSIAFELSIFYLLFGFVAFRFPVLLVGLILVSAIEIIIILATDLKSTYGFKTGVGELKQTHRTGHVFVVFAQLLKTSFFFVHILYRVWGEWFFSMYARLDVVLLVGLIELAASVGLILRKSWSHNLTMTLAFLGYLDWFLLALFFPVIPLSIIIILLLSSSTVIGLFRPRKEEYKNSAPQN